MATPSGSLDSTPTALTATCSHCWGRGWYNDRDPWTGAYRSHPCPVCAGRGWYSVPQSLEQGGQQDRPEGVKQ